METFSKRRARVQSRLEPKSVLILTSARPAIKSNDVHYKFRQDSDLYYLTGFEEEQCALVLYKDKSILYLRKKDPENETWNGRMLGLEDAVQTLGIDEAKEFSSFQSDLPGILRGRDTLYYHYGRDPVLDGVTFEAADRLVRRSRGAEFGPSKIVHPALILHEMRLIKDETEIQRLEACAAITAEAHIALMKTTKPGSYEHELEAILHGCFRKHGGFEAYPSIVASGENACILHYIQNDRRIEDKELVLVDAGAEKLYMNADVTRTFPSSKTFTPAQKAAYEVVLEAQLNCIKNTVSGRTMEETHLDTVKDLVRGLIDIGILKGSIEENVSKNLYRKYYMHRTGHWLGMDVHDVGAYAIAGEFRKLAPGMVCTVEPGLYFPSTDDVPAEFRSIGIRIEDDVLVTEGAARVLTHATPKTIDEIQKLRTEAFE